MWPDEAKHGCTVNGNDWLKLDGNLTDISMTSSCQSLCIQQKTSGCCFLNAAGGCWWKGGADVSTDETLNGLAVKCIAPGKNAFAF